MPAEETLQQTQEHAAQGGTLRGLQGEADPGVRAAEVESTGQYRTLSFDLILSVAILSHCSGPVTSALWFDARKAHFNVKL